MSLGEFTIWVTKNKTNSNNNNTKKKNPTKIIQKS